MTHFEEPAQMELITETFNGRFRAIYRVVDGPVIDIAEGPTAESVNRAFASLGHPTPDWSKARHL